MRYYYDSVNRPTKSYFTENTEHTYTYDELGRLHDYALINPKVLSYSDELTYLPSGEGCLSVDREVKGLVHRHKRITFKALVLENNKLIEKTIKLKDYIAVVFQHEYDHLQGYLFE